MTNKNFICLGFNYEYSKKFPTMFDYADKCFELSRIISLNIDHKKFIINKLTPYQVVSISLFYKSIGTFLTTINLCNLGFIQDNRDLMRKLIEHYITLKYIHIDKEKNSKLFLNHAKIDLKNYLELAKKNNYNVEFNEFLIKSSQKIIDDYEKIKCDYDLDNKSNIPNNFKYKWSGLSIGKMAEKCGLSKLYNIEYGYFSISVHPSVDSVLTYIDYDSAKIGFLNDEKEVPHAIKFACSIFNEISSILIENFKFDLMESLNYLKENEPTIP